MIPFVAEHKKEVGELCRKYPVKRLEVFGFGADGDWRPWVKGLDFLVEFAEMPAKGPDVFETYFGLKEGLETLFRCDVGLATTESNFTEYPSHRKFVEETKELLYAA